MGKGAFALPAIAVLAILALSSMAYAAYNDPCLDGTAYGACSVKTPGYRCWFNSATGVNTLTIMLDDAPASLKCPCSAVSGYAEVNGACVKATCNVGSQTVQAGACLNNQKCDNGVMVEDPATCGCPSGKMAQAGACVDRTGGCRWTGSLKCLTYQDCTFDKANANDDGTCTTKQGCQYANYNGQSCDLTTQVCNTQTGKCDRKSGTCATNADCSGGNICTGGTCMAGANTGTDSVPILSGNAATPSTASDTTSSSKTTLCCLPIAIGSAGVGLAFFRRRK